MLSSLRSLFWKCIIVSFLVITCFDLCEFRLLFGFRTKYNAYLSSTSTLAPHGFNIVDSYEWLRPIGRHSIAGLQGDSGDCELVFSSLAAFDTDYRLRSLNEVSMPADSVANICRSVIANGLNKGEHLDVNGLIAGWSAARQSPVLYWLDSIGSLKEVPYAAHGNEFPLVLSLLDDHASRSKGVTEKEIINLNEAEAVELVQSVWSVIKKRKVENVGPCRLWSVGSEGCRNLGILR